MAGGRIIAAAKAVLRCSEPVLPEEILHIEHWQLHEASRKKNLEPASIRVG
jgi:hypothetical protein